MRISYKVFGVSLIISVISGVLVYKFTSLYKIDGFDKALESVLQFSSISLGFYGTCMSVLASIFNTKVVKGIMKDKEDRMEFIIIACSTLIIGFLTVITTIVYQVMIENKNVSNLCLDLISSFWSSVCVMFICTIFLFTIISFLIFFNNKDEEYNSNNVYNPQLKNNRN
ncbi:hypothetical protein B4065_0148 [Caldibacillus thermoamylovorans]|jgi:hypothetical protein|uniref:Uncharacterized protein n=1 Tax=Aeribacillus phage AP45 TaxID=1913112 RepID=A0A1L2JY43_9CAUD|nr:hypothetical protein [Caldibacillus thermoamylovorans]YP_009831949.1 hypothetical protein HWD36_gp36 [Aeribacillus phage AP45]APC46485.1 hypothetical protein [Aeribacillus phage AP45]KIO60222.1 hypothetical protein B4065_0148 [Caldibacillus thermoamylovorans]